MGESNDEQICSDSNFYVFVMVFIPPVKSFAWESYILRKRWYYMYKKLMKPIWYMQPKKQNSKDIPLIIRFMALAYQLQNNLLGLKLIIFS